MTSGIYTYWDNEKGYYAYVGKDSYIDKNKRYKEHLRPSMYDDQPFNRILQNNPDRYEYRVLMEGNYNNRQLNKMEKFFIKHLKTFHYDYPDRSVFNFTKGGDGGIGYIHSEKTRQKISQKLTGKTLSDERKMNMSKSRNTSGYYRVSKVTSKRYTQGFYWQYKYKEGLIRSVSLDKLEKKVLSKGLPWRKL